MQGVHDNAKILHYSKKKIKVICFIIQLKCFERNKNFEHKIFPKTRTKQKDPKSLSKTKKKPNSNSAKKEKTMFLKDFYFSKKQ